MSEVGERAGRVGERASLCHSRSAVRRRGGARGRGGRGSQALAKVGPARGTAPDPGRRTAMARGWRAHRSRGGGRACETGGRDVDRRHVRANPYRRCCCAPPAPPAPPHGMTAHDACRHAVWNVAPVARAPATEPSCAGGGAAERCSGSAAERTGRPGPVLPAICVCGGRRRAEGSPRGVRRGRSCQCPAPVRTRPCHRGQRRGRGSNATRGTWVPGPEPRPSTTEVPLA